MARFGPSGSSHRNPRNFRAAIPARVLGAMLSVSSRNPSRLSTTPTPLRSAYATSRPKSSSFRPHHKAFATSSNPPQYLGSDRQSTIVFSLDETRNVPPAALSSVKPKNFLFERVTNSKRAAPY